jgi:hypothetical protein
LATEKAQVIYFSPSLCTIFSIQECDISESPELKRIVRQFVDANRAFWQVEKDF